MTKDCNTQMLLNQDSRYDHAETSFSHLNENGVVVKGGCSSDVLHPHLSGIKEKHIGSLVLITHTHTCTHTHTHIHTHTHTAELFKTTIKSKQNWS